MLNLNFTINGTDMVCSEATQGTLIIPADTVNYVTCNFTFNSDDWANTNKTAYFKNASYERVMQVPISNGTCKIPWEVLANAGTLLLTVVGVVVDGTTVTYQVKAGPLSMYVQKDVMFDAYPSIPPTATEYQQFVSNVQEYANTATTKAGEASASAVSAASSASEALGYKNTASSSASSATTSAGQAANYKNEAIAAAANAASSASSASSYSSSASDFADSAEAYKDAAAISATTATNASNSANSSKNAAASSATAASNSATTAGTSATNAATSASAASSSASTASAAADEAEAYAHDADVSRTDATQQAEYAEEARDDAIAAKDIAASKAVLSESWAIGGTGTRTGESTNNSKYFSEQSSSSASSASTSASNASSSATAASNSATAANTSAVNASASESNASSAATTASNSAASAASSSSVAALSASAASSYAEDASDSKVESETAKNVSTAKSILSESWAVGGTGTRTGEDSNNAKYWAQQASQNQVQANWLETNPTSKAYIQNKPTIPSLSAYRTSADQDVIDAGKANVGDSYTKSESDNKYLTTHQSLAAYRTSSAQDAIDAGKATVASVSAIEEKIPSQASSSNKLADKDFVNSSIATNTANYISNNGEPFTSLAQLQAYSGIVTHNDYAFIAGQDQHGNAYFDRYKASVDYTVEPHTVTWAKEYRLNNSSFTAVQWAAINSAISSEKVAIYDAYASAIASKYVKPDGGIPKSDLASAVQTSLGKADSALQSHQSLSGYATESWVNAKGYGTYSKPNGGIPKTDLASAVQSSLDKADSALQSHQSLAGYATESWVNAKGYGTYTKPGTGIPKSDMSSGVQSSLDKADSALQSHQDISGKQNVYLARTVTIAVSDWSNNTCSKTVNGVTTSNLIEVSPSVGSRAIFGSAGVYASAQATDSVTFECSSVPTEAITVQVVIWR